MEVQFGLGQAGDKGVEFGHGASLAARSGRIKRNERHAALRK
jgi:hypothetical protein